MMPADVALMRRLARANQAITDAVMMGLPRDDHSPMSPEWLREMARQLQALAQDMQARADEIDSAPKAISPYPLQEGGK